jgi:hypothetical protein
MSQRNIGKSPALAAPYGGNGGAQGDPYRAMAEALGRPPAALQFVGVDMASGPDQSAMALATRKGSHVVLITGATPTLERDWINGLDAGRKADREALAMALTMLAHNRGAKVEQKASSPNPGYCGAGLDLLFELNGVGAMVDIDNLHGGRHALVSWYNSERGARNFTTRFCGMVGSTSAGRPHHKATSCPQDWYSLAMWLDGGLLLAARGDAFEPAAS